MRNLKKILALVLALVMSLSLMATAGAGSFQDVTDDNPYKTAIDVLDELKVFQGFEDGSFKPTDTLNRAQAAVLVYRIATGDVEGKYIDNYTYMAQSKFNDLEGYNWAKGYINYCQNAGIVVGTSATTFAPGAKVTGYQLLVMLLRTLGYGKAGEFADPKGWELQTASIAEREEITKYVTGGDFENPAPRQMVAEILFRGLLTETVEYSALVPGGYTKSGETLGKRELGLEDVKGVVMANEFADLEDTDTLAADKTRLVDADGKVYNLDIKSELTDIGEIRHAYVQNGTKVLTTLENLNDSTVNQPENGKGTKVSALSKVNDDTQYFVNFGDLLEATKSEHRIEYLLVTKMSKRAAYELVRDNGGVAWLDKGLGSGHEDNGKVDPDETAIDADAVKAINGTPAWDALDTTRQIYTYNKIIKVGEDITTTDIANIKNIFYGSDSRDGVVTGKEEYWGEVYVNTKSGSDKDISDDISYNKFYEDYIGTELVKFTESDNGEWLKTIDNNGDGVADYVFLTTFTMSVVNDYNAKKDTYSVEFDGENKRDVDGEIVKSAIVGKSDLSAGEVILYTEIDGKVYVDEPETEQASIDKKGIDAKAQTITCGGEVKEWSGIEQEAYHFYHDVAEAQTEVAYTLYKDHFGYIRLFEESSKGIVLLTDGYYATDLKNEYTYKAEIYDDAAEKLAEVSVADPRGTGRWNFIYDNINGTPSNREEGVWDRLKGFDVDYNNHVDNTAVKYTVEDVELTRARDYITSVAAYDVDANSEYRLDRIGTITGRYNWTQHELDVSSFSDIKDKDLDITANHSGDVGRNDTLNRINATDETLYYFVEYYADATDNGRRVNPKVDSVTTWTGYANATKDLDKDNDRAYAVTRAYRNAANTAWLNYETAEIIVIEHAIKAPETTVLPFSLNNRLTGTYKNEVTGTGFLPEGPDAFTGKAQEYNTLSIGNGFAPIDISDLLLFYKITADGDLELITENFSKHDIYAGVVETVRGTSTRNYGEIAVVDRVDNGKPIADPAVYGHDDVTLHDISRDSDNYYTIGYNREAALKLDEALRVPGYQQSILYGNVTNTFSDDALDVTKMERGDRVIYIPGGYYINVDKSLTKTDDLGWVYPGVFEGDPHTYNTTTKVTTDYTDTEEWTLEDLWELIALDQVDRTTYEAPKVTFYGVADTNSAPDLAAADNAITVSYKTAAGTLTTANTIVVTPVDGNAITRVVAKIVGGDDVEMSKAEIDGKNCYVSDPIAPSKDTDVVYSVTVYYDSEKDTVDHETWTLTQNKQVETFGELKTKHEPDDETNNPAGIQILVSDVAGTGTASINVAKAAGTMLSTLEAMLKTDIATDNVTLKVVDAGGEVIEDLDKYLQNYTVSDFVATGAKLYAIITNVDGNEKEVAITLTATDSTAELFTFTNAKGETFTNPAGTTGIDIGVGTSTAYYTIMDENGNYYDAAGVKQAGPTYIVGDGNNPTATQPGANVTVTAGLRAVFYADDTTTAIDYLKANEESVLTLNWINTNTPNAYVKYSKATDGTSPAYKQITSVYEGGDANNVADVSITMPDYDIKIESVDVGAGRVGAICYLGVIVDDGTRPATYVARHEKLDMSTVAAAIGDTADANEFYRVMGTKTVAVTGDYVYTARDAETAVKATGIETITVWPDDSELAGHIRVETGFYSVSVTNDNAVADMVASIKDNDAALTLGYTETVITDTHYIKGGETFVLTGGTNGFKIGTTDYGKDGDTDATYEVEITANTRIAILAHS